MMSDVKTGLRWTAFGVSALILTAAAFQTAPRRETLRTASQGANSGAIVMRMQPSAVSGFMAVDFWNTQVGWAVSGAGIYGTRDGGKTFSREYTSSNAQLYGIQALSSENAWVFGYNSILRTTDGGRRWTALAAPSGPGAISDVAFSSPAVGYAVTGNVTSGSTRVWRTSDGGRTWRRCAAPAGTSELAWYGPRDGFLLTGAGGLYETLNGGRTWRMTKRLPKVQGEYPASGRLIADGPHDAWLMLFGGAGMSQGSYAVFHTTNGANWKPVLGVSTAGAGPAPGGAGKAPVGPGSSPGGLAVVSPRIAYMSGGCEACGNGTVQLDGTANGGRTWSHGAVIFGAGSYAYGNWSVSFPTKQDGWLATQTGLLHSTDSGRTWREAFPLAALAPVTASFVTPMLGYGVGVVGDANTVLRTTNGGRVWTAVGALPGRAAGPNDWSAGTSVSFATAADGYATIYGHVYRTIDGGRRWKLVKLPDKTGYGYALVQFLSPRLGVIGQPDYGGNQPMWTTTNGGATWHLAAGTMVSAMEGLVGRPLRQRLAAQVGAGGASAGGAAQSGVWGNRLAWLTTPYGNEIALTTDGGQKWTTLRFPVTVQPGVRELQFVTAQVGWLQAQSGAWYRTTDGGRRWTWEG